jgi:hypothetical protein
MQNKTLVVIFLAFLFGGCAFVKDAPRNVMGFSVRDIEAARGNASSQVYQAASADIFKAVIEEFQLKKYYVFTKDEIRGFISVMNIPGVVDTTEVGVFITALPAGKGVKVELSSRSTPAKRIVALALFEKLGEKFQSR